MQLSIRLVLFTRFPQPGHAKTRLIPVLGPERAADLHGRLTERTIAIMRATGLPIEIRTTGAACKRFRDWLGPDLALVDQGDGDLGERLTRAAAEPPVILLGADTPDLSVAHLEDAADALRRGDSVIGAAEDGGYWLLGLPRPMPFLFADMPWSTDRVAALTLSRLSERGITPVMLETLADLDRPEDLARWPSLAAGASIP